MKQSVQMLRNSGVTGNTFSVDGPFTLPPSLSPCYLCPGFCRVTAGLLGTA